MENDSLLFPADVANLADGVAASLWLHAFADACDRAREELPAIARDRVPHPGAGGDWADIVPACVPQRYSGAAASAIGRVAITTLSYGRAAWLRLCGYVVGDADGSERFAHVLASVMIGSGVGFADDMTSSAMQGATAQDRADRDAVERLRKALPRIGEACELFAWWNPETGRVE